MAEWISVKERLPEPLAYVLAHHDGGKIEKGWIDYDGEWLYENAFGEITHWMPLPEPPKEDAMSSQKQWHRARSMYEDELNYYIRRCTWLENRPYWWMFWAVWRWKKGGARP